MSNYIAKKTNILTNQTTDLSGNQGSYESINLELKNKYDSVKNIAGNQIASYGDGFSVKNENIFEGYFIAKI